ncbi:MAG: ribosome silencing factor [Burkholderiaceae bacterium]|nr:ribosome silencing factor [Burkholderiaceae bacterium]
MDIRKLQRAIVDGLEDVKAQNIVVFNTEHLSPLFERVIIASGTSNRQTKSLASSVRETVKARGLEVMRTEGEENGEWIIVDCGAAVVHVMQPSIRDYYHLEEIWGGKPVKLKMSDGETRLVKASEDASETGKGSAKSLTKSTTAKAPAPRRSGSKAEALAESKPAKKTAAKGSVSKTTGVKTATKTAVKTAAKPAAKRASAKEAAPKLIKVGDKKPAAKKAAAKTSAKPAVKAVAKAPAARKTVARKKA